MAPKAASPKAKSTSSPKGKKGSPSPEGATREQLRSMWAASANQKQGSNVRLTASLLSLVAATILIIDVILGHEHSVLATSIAGALLGTAALLHFIARSCCVAGEAYRKASCNAILADVLALVNLICLDAYLYEEGQYNHWGHSDNVLRNERTAAAVLEVVLATAIFGSVRRQYLMSEKYEEEEALAQAGRGMV